MKDWKIYTYLLVIYIVMQIGGAFLAQATIIYLKTLPGWTEIQATYHGLAWSQFAVNVIAAILFLAILIRNKKFMNVFKGKKSSLGMAVAWGLLGFILAMGGQMIAASIESALGITAGSDNTMLLGDIAKVSPIMIVPIVLFAPFLEELIFRRVIFGGVYKKTNFWIAAIVSALVFAAVHMEFEHLLMYMMPAFAFSFVYYKTKRILAPIIAHLVMNGFVTVVQLNIDVLEDMQKIKQGIVFILFY